MKCQEDSPTDRKQPVPGRAGGGGAAKPELLFFLRIHIRSFLRQMVSHVTRFAWVRQGSRENRDQLGAGVTGAGGGGANL